MRLRAVDALFGSAPRRSKLLLLGSGVCVALVLFLLPKLLATYGVAIGWFGIGAAGIGSIVIGYALLAGVEEISKFVVGWFSYVREHLSSNDLILYSIIIALGFAFGENIIYIIVQNSSLTDASSLAVSRGFTGFLGHAIFTGTIGLIASRVSGLRNIYRVIIALIAGIGLHLIYNLLLHYGIILGFLIYIIAGYLLLSYLFYTSDRIYLD